MNKPLAVVVALTVVQGGACATSSPGADDRPPPARRAEPPAAADDPTARLSSEAVLALLESEVRLQQGDAAAAVDLLREAVLHDPDSAYLRIRLGEAHVEAGDFDAAAEAARAALQAQPGDVDAMRLLALVLDLSGDRAQAEDVLRRALETAPGDRKTTSMLAEMLVADGKVQEAEAVVESMMQASPAGVDPWVFLARTFAERGDVGRALVHLDRALDRAPHDVEALRLKLTLLQAQGRWQEALPLAKSLAAEEGDGLETRATLLQCLLLADRLDEARAVVDAWLHEDRGVAMIASVADSYERAGRRDDALATILAQPSPSPELRLEAARMQAAARRFADAARTACAIADAPGDDDVRDRARVLCALAHAEAGDGARASAALKDVAARWSTSPRLLGALGKVATTSGATITPADAAAAAERAAAQSDDADVVEAAARTYEDLGRPADARAAIDDALKKKPKDAALVMTLARFLERNGQRRAAIELAERLLDRRQGDVDVLNFVAFSLAEEGLRPDDARRYAWRALVLDPLNGYVVDTLGWAELRAGDATTALATLARADRLAPDEPEILLHLAEALRQDGKGDDAKKVLERARALVPKDDPLAPRIDAMVGALRAGAK